MSEHILSIVKEGLRLTLELPAEQQIGDQEHLKNDLGIDSVTSMDLLLYLEDNIEGFTVEADTLEAKHFNTAASMTEYITGELIRLNLFKEETAKV